MKLSKLYCNKDFHNTKFNEGINIIYADVKAKIDPESSHNLGKSKLIELIDFLLLKKIVPKDYFLTSTKSPATNTLLFAGYEFYLEIHLNSGDFITIKRTTNESSKVSMRTRTTTVKDFNIVNEWDHQNITVDDAKELLNESLGFNFFSGGNFDYRDTVNYCLRKQGDYGDPFQLEKFKFDEKKLKTLMFELLGFEGGILTRKYDKEAEIKQKQKVISEQRSNFDINANQKDEIEGFLQVLNKSKNELIGQLDSLNFFDSDDKVISELAEEIETRISELNKISFNLQYEIKKLRESITANTTVDLNAVRELFRQVNLHFSDSLNKSYEQVLEFNRQISQERIALLNDTLTQKSEKLVEVKSALKDANKRRQQYRELLLDNTIMMKLKYSQNELLQLENRIARHEAQLSAIKVIERLRSEIESLETELKSIVKEISDLVDSTLKNERYVRIRALFSDYAFSILAYHAIISISLNKNNNIDFKYRIGETKRSEGHTYKKMLCIAFDLSILAEYSKESYFRFIYHDDVFSNQENKIRIRLLNLVREYSEDLNIQYIFSIIKDDVPRDSNGKLSPLNKEEIIMELHDKNDSGKLLKLSF